jgi:hypothetical protein
LLGAGKRPLTIDFGAGVKVRIEAGVPKDVIAATLKALR